MKQNSKEEIDALIAQLKERIADLIEEDEKFDNDFYLYRWLLHNQMTVDRTEKNIRQSVKWRKENKIDELANQELGYESPGVEKELILTFSGVSKSGRPVTTLNADGVNVREQFRKYGRNALFRFAMQNIAKHEKLMLDHYKQVHAVEAGISKEETSKTGRHSRTATGYNPSWYYAAPIYIASYKNLSLKDATYWEGVRAQMEVINVGLKYFPSVISSLYVVNLNKFSNMVVNTAKPLLKSDSFDMNFFGEDKCEWSKELLEIIDADQLPSYFGGTKIVDRKNAAIIS